MWPFDIPTPLHKYGDENLIQSLINENLMFSKPSDLNDPFEFLPSLKAWSQIEHGMTVFTVAPHAVCSFENEDTPDFALSKAVDFWRSTLEKNWFITSLTTKSKDPRMWSQYGGNHTGLKLTFNLTHPHMASHAKELMLPVKYDRPSRYAIAHYVHEPQTPENLAKALMEITTTKGPSWSHEEEYRWFLRDNPEDPTTSPNKRLINGKMRAFISLPHSCITKVTLGYSSSNSLHKALIEVRKLTGAKWAVVKAKLSLDSFEFDEEVIISAE
jgi:hypothetical protein